MGADATNEIVNRVEEIAKKRNISMAQVALAWMLSKDGTSFDSWKRCMSEGIHFSCRGADCGYLFGREIA